MKPKIIALPAATDEVETKFVFTDKALKRLDLHAPRRYTDAQCEGLRLDVKNGKLFFEMRWRDGNKHESMRLGQFRIPVPKMGDPAYPGHTTIAKARETVHRLRHGWEYQNRNPRLAVKGRRVSNLTLADDMETYLTVRSEGWKASTVEDACDVIRRNMGRHCATILNRRTHLLTPEEIATVLRDIAKRGPRVPTQVAPMIGTQHYIRRLLFRIIKRAMHERIKRWALGAENPASDAALEPYINLKPQIKEPRRAMPLAELPSVYRRLWDWPQTSTWNRLARARLDRRGFASQHWRQPRAPFPLRFLLLACAPRSGEVRQAIWAQMHLDDDNPFWRIPGTAMKTEKIREQGGKDRDIPLSYAAVALLLSIRPVDYQPTDFVFPGDNGMINPATMRSFLQEALGVDATVHGIRANLLDFAMENHPELTVAAQIALDHKSLFGSVTDRYRRTMLPHHRRILADVWAMFLEQELPPEQRTPIPEKVLTRLTMHNKPPAEWPQLRLLGA